ncbi:Imm50 family immunity protein [Streptomyces sp. NPDC051320]|uniref:Imm50 family immunity protein n=1 Tax=Streptomyces sp. NPDC051320 TaxID=3154644 RepID=UPI003438B20D
MTWVDFVRNPEVLSSLFVGSVPPLDELRLRSINVSYIGPSVTLRVDLPQPLSTHPPEWAEEEFDTLQCHLAFQAVEEIVLDQWTPPEFCKIEIAPRADYRMHVEVTGGRLRLSFDGSQDILVNHVSAFKMNGDGSDSGRHQYARKIDKRMYDSTPAVHETSFYG